MWGTPIPWLLPPATCAERAGSSGPKAYVQVLAVGSRHITHKHVKHQKGLVGTQAGCARRHSGAGAGVALPEREEWASA